LGPSRTERAVGDVYAATERKHMEAESQKPSIRGMDKEEGRASLVRSLILTAALLVWGAGGCSREPAFPAADILQGVGTGTLKGEVYRALGPGPVDSTQYAGRTEYGYPVGRYLVEGETVEVVWVPHRGYLPGDSLDWRGSTPILFRNIAMLAWGWEEVEPLAEEMGLVLPGMDGHQPRPGQDRPVWDEEDQEAARSASNSGAG
jgi:hypothetical protein